MIRRLFQVAIFLFFANALYQAAPAGVHYFRFKDAVRELALFGQKFGDREMADQVMKIAAEHKIPLDRDYVEVKRTAAEIVITASYIETMTFVPGYPREQQFDVEVRAYLVKEPPGR
jgi:hypothetical protein